MTPKHTIDSIQKSHPLGFTAIFKINSSKEILCSAINISGLTIALIATSLCLILGINEYNVLVEVKNVLIAFLPGILGFTIAGFTLFVGFIQSDLLENITKKDQFSDYTLYQKMVSKFALSVLAQSLAMALGYFYHFIIFYGNQSKFIIINPHVEHALNNLGLFFIWYLFVISVFLVSQVIVNIFNFSQLHHFDIVKTKLDKDKK